jgi:tetratricopeptide (TPR) repeat protein
LGQYAPAAEAYASAADHGAPPSIARLGQAEALIHLARYDQAAGVLQALVKGAPSAQAYDRLGYACFRARQIDPALDAYRAALALDGDDIPALNGQGVCLMTNYLLSNHQDQSPRDQALDSWRKSLRLQPNQSNIVDLLARYQNS